MGDLLDTPVRLVAMIVAVVAIVPAGLVILRHLLTLRDPAASPRARALDVVWTIVPLAALLVLIGASAVA